MKRKTTNADALNEVATILQDLIDSGWDADTDAPHPSGQTAKLGTMIDEALETAQAGAAADDDRETIKVLRTVDRLAFDLGAKAVMDAVEACFAALDGIDDDSVTRSAGSKSVETKGPRDADGWWVEVFVSEAGTKYDEDDKWAIEALCERLGGEFRGGGGGGSSFQGLFSDEESARSFIDAVEDLGYGEIEGSGSNDLTQDVHPSGMDERGAGAVETKGRGIEVAVRLDPKGPLGDKVDEDGEALAELSDFAEEHGATDSGAEGDTFYATFKTEDEADAFIEAVADYDGVRGADYAKAASRGVETKDDDGRPVFWRVTIPLEWRGAAWADHKEEVLAAAENHDGRQAAAAAWEFTSEEDAQAFCDEIGLDEDSIRELSAGAVETKGLDPEARDAIVAIKNKIEQVLESNLADGGLDIVEGGVEDAEAWAEKMMRLIDDLSQTIGSGSFTDASYELQEIIDSSDSMGLEDELQRLQDYLEEDSGSEDESTLMRSAGALSTKSRETAADLLAEVLALVDGASIPREMHESETRFRRLLIEVYDGLDDYGGRDVADARRALQSMRDEIDVRFDGEGVYPEEIDELLELAIENLDDEEKAMSRRSLATKASTDFDSLAEEYNGSAGAIGDADYQFDSEDDARDFADAAEELGATVKFVAAPLGRYGVNIVDEGKSMSRRALKTKYCDYPSYAGMPFGSPTLSTRYQDIPAGECAELSYSVREAGEALEAASEIYLQRAASAARGERDSDDSAPDVAAMNTLNGVAVQLESLADRLLAIGDPGDAAAPTLHTGPVYAAEAPTCFYSWPDCLPSCLAAVEGALGSVTGDAEYLEVAAQLTVVRDMLRGLLEECEEEEEESEEEIGETKSTRVVRTKGRLGRLSAVSDKVDYAVDALAGFSRGTPGVTDALRILKDMQTAIEDGDRDAFGEALDELGGVRDEVDGDLDEGETGEFPHELAWLLSDLTDAYYGNKSAELETVKGHSVMRTKKASRRSRFGDERSAMDTLAELSTQLDRVTDEAWTGRRRIVDSKARAALETAVAAASFVAESVGESISNKAPLSADQLAEELGRASDALRVLEKSGDPWATTFRDDLSEFGSLLGRSASALDRYLDEAGEASGDEDPDGASGSDETRGSTRGEKLRRRQLAEARRAEAEIVRKADRAARLAREVQGLERLLDQGDPNDEAFARAVTAPASAQAARRAARVRAY